MADFKSRHAFGSEANVDSAIQRGLIDAYDVLFLDEKKIGWVDKNGNKVILENKKQILSVTELPDVGDMETVYIYNGKFYYWDGQQFNCPENMTEAAVDEKIAGVVEDVKSYTDTATEDTKVYVDDAVKDAKVYTDEKVSIAEKIKYEIVSKPVGTLVNYSEKEIRVMCPANTAWAKQNVGVTGNANMYYIGFKAYAPDGAVSFKEGDNGMIDEEMLYFTGDFAGTDAFGRKYSIVWLPVAAYDDKAAKWTYYGDKSTSSKYIGWDYVVEWYDANGVMIASDGVRINLSNENCHTFAQPYYVNNAVDAANAYTDKKIADAFAVEVVEF